MLRNTRYQNPYNLNFAIWTNWLQKFINHVSFSSEACIITSDLLWEKKVSNLWSLRMGNSQKGPKITVQMFQTNSSRIGANATNSSRKMISNCLCKCVLVYWNFVNARTKLHILLSFGEIHIAFYKCVGFDRVICFPST